MYDVVVIGAGPSGIVSTKEMIERGFEKVICLEKTDTLGGTFAKGYDGLLLTSSAVFSMFSDFPIGEDENHHHWTKDEALDYWRRYAQYFKVNDCIKYNAVVSQLKQISDNHWVIVLKTGEEINAKNVIVAVGTNSSPRYPGWAAEISKIPVMHAQDYKNAASFKGKRVLVVGGGEGGSDIALEVSKVAKQCCVSLRGSTGWVTPRKRNGRAADISTHRGFWKLPRAYGAEVSQKIMAHDRSINTPVYDAIGALNKRVQAEKGIWGTYGTKTLSLPIAMAQYGCEIVDGVSKVENGGRSLLTDTGDCLKDIDAIIFCTGYVNRVPYLEENLQVASPRALYKHVFHPKVGGSLAFVGWARPGFGSQFPLMEMQARWCGHVFKGDKPLPREEDMIAEAHNDAARYLDQFEGNTRNIEALVDYHTYIDDLASKIGCTLPTIKYFFLRPRLWLHIVYGPTQATQFRLTGPGEKFKLARAMILKMPVCKLNHVVRAGLLLQIKLFTKRLFSFGKFKHIRNN
jgi:dimethylaniline monooxygenase (N-oxide forming)